MLTFRKAERLCSKKLFNTLFGENHSFIEYPLVVIWVKTDFVSPFPAQIAFSVSKKNFKRAVKRNLIRRRMRETYRKNKSILYEYLTKKNLKIVFLINYIAKEILPYATIEISMKKSLEQLMKNIEKHYPTPKE